MTMYRLVPGIVGRALDHADRMYMFAGVVILNRIPTFSDGRFCVTYLPVIIMKQKDQNRGGDILDA